MHYSIGFYWHEANYTKGKLFLYFNTNLDCFQFCYLDKNCECPNLQTKLTPVMLYMDGKYSKAYDLTTLISNEYMPFGNSSFKVNFKDILFAKDFLSFDVLSGNRSILSSTTEKYIILRAYLRNIINNFSPTRNIESIKEIFLKEVNRISQINISEIIKSLHIETSQTFKKRLEGTIVII
jgi:hypothetical protein